MTSITRQVLPGVGVVSGSVGWFCLTDCSTSTSSSVTWWSLLVVVSVCSVLSAAGFMSSSHISSAAAAAAVSVSVSCDSCAGITHVTSLTGSTLVLQPTTDKSLVSLHGYDNIESAVTTALPIEAVVRKHNKPRPRAAHCGIAQFLGIDQKCYQVIPWSLHTFPENFMQISPAIFS